MGKVYGYCRVSSKGQLDGNSLEQQSKEILSKYPHAIIVQEQYTGAKVDRPYFKELLNELESNDLLVVTKLDRFARSTQQGLDTINELLKRDVSVHILNLGMMDNTPASELTRTIFLAFAQFERAMIVERTQEGKAIARQRDDFREGRPKVYGKAQINHALELLETKTYKQVEELTGISKSTLIRAKRKQKAESISQMWLMLFIMFEIAMMVG